MNPWWQRAIEAAQNDFSDLNDASQLARLVVRLSMAAVLSGLLGWQREGVGKAAGLRTHMLVAMGAAIYVLVAEQSGLGDDPMSRVLQGLVAGVGFLGAGAILKISDQGEIRGLTTAAGIWLTAGIGVAAGMGQEASAIVITIFAWVTLAIIPRLEGRWGNHRGP